MSLKPMWVMIKQCYKKLPLTPKTFSIWDYVTLQRIGSQSWKGWEYWVIFNPHPIQLVSLVFKEKWQDHHLSDKWQKLKICWRSYIVMYVGHLMKWLEEGSSIYYLYIWSIKVEAFDSYETKGWFLWKFQRIQSLNREPNWEKY